MKRQTIIILVLVAIGFLSVSFAILYKSGFITTIPDLLSNQKNAARHLIENNNQDLMRVVDNASEYHSEDSIGLNKNGKPVSFQDKAVKKALLIENIEEIRKSDEAIDFIGDMEMCKDFGFWGIYYSFDDRPYIGHCFTDKIPKRHGKGWAYIQDRKYGWYYTEKISGNFYYYEGIFYP